MWRKGADVPFLVAQKTGWVAFADKGVVDQATVVREESSTASTMNENDDEMNAALGRDDVTEQDG